MNATMIATYDLRLTTSGLKFAQTNLYAVILMIQTVTKKFTVMSPTVFKIQLAIGSCF